MTAGTIEIEFSELDTGSAGLVVPPAPVTPVNDGLAKLNDRAASPVDVKKALSCKDTLRGDTLAEAQARATEVYPEMLRDPSVMLGFGSKSLRGVNDLVERMLHGLQPAEVPELAALMKDLGEGMAEIKRRYDVSDPKVRQNLAKRGGGRIFGHGKSIVELLMEDAERIDALIGRIGRVLHERQFVLLRNVVFYDELYKANEEAIGRLFRSIAIMEMIRDMAAADQQSVAPDPGMFGDNNAERRGSMTDFVMQMEVKISGYKNRLMVAWATSPQVRTMRTLNEGLALKINELLTIGIPTMQATIVRWRDLAQMTETAQLVEQVQSATDVWLQADAAVGAELVPRIARAVTSTPFTPQAIAAMADSFARQAAAITDALGTGITRRQEMEQAMTVTRDVLGDPTIPVPDELVTEIVTSATRPLELDAA